jgi:hypothetical protein
VPASGNPASLRTGLYGAATTIRATPRPPARREGPTASGHSARRRRLRTSLAIGRSGHLHATTAIMRPDDPCWHESAAGHAADIVTQHERRTRPKPAPASALTEQERAAARTLVHVMQRIRLVGYYPKLAGRIPVRELCEATAGAGTAILWAGTRRDRHRQALADPQQRWRHLPPDATPAPIPRRTGQPPLRLLQRAAPRLRQRPSRPGHPRRGDTGHRPDSTMAAHQRRNRPADTVHHHRHRVQRRRQHPPRQQPASTRR